ncbi:hypothetical protein ZHAS_00021819 [Anopheles sinensis]|uniref:Ionotropic receptor n=1 Tax=Anopheles sinensis TaxID=74873 RepID=A0A084WTN9_ANOSI|nr:hypothetical protein ZHAS_00021819 [Anopheles sinensis]
MERLEELDDYLALPYPRIVKEDSIGTPDQSTLVVMFVDTSSMDSFRKSLYDLFNRSHNNHPPDGKYLVLVDDQPLHMHGAGLAISLAKYMQHLGIIFWCLAGRNGASMYYVLAMAHELTYYHGELNFGVAFDREKVAPIQRMKLVAQFFVAFPFTNRIESDVMKGIDYDIFMDIMHHLQLIPVLHHIVKSDPRATIDKFIENLYFMVVDVLLTRRSVNHTFLSMVPIPEPVFYCIVVPRQVNPDFTQALMKPFSKEVWLGIVGWFSVVFIIRRFMRTSNPLSRCIRRLLRWKIFASTYSIVLHVISFVLIESYLAQITSFFIVYQFPSDVASLEEFFATNIPIRVPNEQEVFLDMLEPKLARTIRDRAIDAADCPEFSSRCAHLDSVTRAMYTINHIQSNHPVTGRKPSYVLQEMIFTCHMWYLFARGSSVKNLFELYLQRMYESGLVNQYNRQYEQFIENPRKNIIVDQLIGFEHLKSLVIMVLVGWSLSVVVFLVELSARFMPRMVRRRAQGYRTWLRR